MAASWRYGSKGAGMAAETMGSGVIGRQFRYASCSRIAAPGRAAAETIQAALARAYEK